ncbi:MAG: IMPACT family protein [Rhizobium sp.]|nr:IMPACT family protein [Rhizobium sp.]
MFALAGPATAEQIIKKSRFVAIALPVATEEEAKAVLGAHRRTDANHNCWAWRIGGAYRFSDDGEPGGTAGKPILAAIDGQSLDRTLVIVTRWFGGVLLGSGGLVRAYGGTAALCLRGAERVELRPMVEGWLHLEFSDLALVKARLAGNTDIQVLDERFDATGAELRLRVAETGAEAAAGLVGDLTSGRSRIVFD